MALGPRRQGLRFGCILASLPAYGITLFACCELKVWYGMVNVDLYSAIITKVSYAICVAEFIVRDEKMY